MIDRKTDTLAAEYVLGSLTPTEHAEAARRVASDAAFAAAVSAWERRLAPLAGRVAPVSPPLGTFARILARIPIARRRVMPAFSPMRMAAAVALAAIALVAILALVHERRGGVRAILVAQLHASDRQSDGQDLPAFAVAIDQTAHKLVVNPVSIEDRHGTRYSLWVVKTGDERPITRATLSATDATVLPWRAGGTLSDLVGAHVRISAGEDWTAPQPWAKTASFFEGVLVRPRAR